jgi:hypothetical protein
MVLEKRREARLPTVAQAAASPTAIVLAGAGVAVGELAHLGLAVALVFGGVAYGARLAYASVHRRLALRGRARRRLGRIDPWSVPEPWRTYTTRALEARKRYRQLVADCPPGPVADYLATSVAKVEAATEEHWALAKSGAGLVDPPGRTDKAAKDLETVQAELVHAHGANRSQLESREAELASQLRSFRHLESVSAQISRHLSELSAQLEGVVASAGVLVASAGAAGADLSSLSSELSSLTGALDEARQIMATPPPS